ncbi:telomerase reverse transcriptase [Ornithorhynchus anatinus]|uniref:Telomerase reverse transcriptase n=1 Tax=Ornithorhynchus anatinus TaxID=9258 RepID=F2YSU1_ORNAN|nr:telomerase reverse transcriptase [Ornithorhynchus anatinus]ADZ56329.1 telomerase reverse transcriptase [Ornithorhynchus anatinus]
MASAAPFFAVHAVLRARYAAVLPLPDFVGGLPGAPRGLLPLGDPGDPEIFQTFLAQCVVCLPRGARPLPDPLTFRQLSSQKEIVARIVQRICEKGKKNVLAFGYTLLDENSRSEPVVFTSNVCNYLPNISTESVRTSILWEMLFSRVGDDVIMYLLEHCALFMLVPPNCSYQICGQPIYELPPTDSSPPRPSSPRFFRQRASNRRRDVLSEYVREKIRLHGRRGEQSDRKRRKRRVGERESGAGGRRETRLPSRRTNPGGRERDRPVTDGPRKRPDPGLAPRAAKRYLEKDERGTSGKRRKGAVLAGRDGGPDPGSPSPATPTREVRPEAPGSEASEASRGLLQMQSVPGGRRDREDSRIPSDPPFPERVRGNLVRPGPRVPKTRGLEAPSQPGSTGSAPPGWSSPARSPREEESPRSGAGEQTPGRGPPGSVPESSRAACRPGVFIDRKRLLYSSRDLKERLPRSFPLNRLRGDPAGGRGLVEAIFLAGSLREGRRDPAGRRLGRKKRRLPGRYWRMRHVFRELLQNHGRCPYGVLLRKSCPVRVGAAEPAAGTGPPGGPAGVSLRSAGRAGGRRTASPAGGSPEGSRRAGAVSPTASPGAGWGVHDLLRQHSSSWRVYGFVRECLLRVVPAELWGSSHNKCRFLRNVKAFLALGKFDKFSLRELRWKMRVSDCAWLRSGRGDHSVPASEHRFREEILAKFLHWLMRAYVVELLRAFFYVTETMFQKNLLFFYRKCVWNRLQAIGIRNHLAKVQLQAISEKEIKENLSKKYVPVVSKLRFIPKSNGLRPIVNADTIAGAKLFPKESRDKKVQYFNTQLKNLFSVLNYERTLHPHLLGASMFGIDDIYKAWRQFVLRVLTSKDKERRFYFVKADVTGAYDTIPHDKLVEVISRILKPEDETVYCIQRYAVIQKTAKGSVRKTFRRHVSTLKDFPPSMKQFVSHLQETTSLQNAVVVQQSSSLNETSTSLFAFFRHMIQHNILKIRNRYYVQRRGIPQGSILSTLLCSLCYGDMENRLFPGIQQDGVLLRLIDDFLLVTPHLAQAKLFLRTLAKGIPEYGCFINPRKTVVNFHVDEDTVGCSHFTQLPAGCLFPWCGLLLDTRTLEVYCDYSTYSRTSIRASLSLCQSTSAGRSLRRKLLTVLKLKCHGLFLDVQVNSLRTVCINIYKIFLLQAYRFHACVLRLPFNQRVRKNPEFFLTVIADTASCCYSMVRARNAGVTLGAREASGPFPSEAAQWLCYQAFLTKLANHKVVYKCLLGPLKRSKQQLLRRLPGPTMLMLEAATDPMLCQDFKTILD